jgi:hypothetical protein
MPGPYPIALSDLSPREAITDALYRAILGFDRNDPEIFDSAFAGEDVSFELRSAPEPPTIVNRLSNIKAGVLASVGKMDTLHVISNVRVSYVDGEDTAGLKCYAQAQHCPEGRGREPDGPKWLVGGEYEIEFLRDGKDGLWKIKRWVLDVVWREGDRSVMGRG